MDECTELICEGIISLQLFVDELQILEPMGFERPALSFPLCHQLIVGQAPETDAPAFQDDDLHLWLSLAIDFHPNFLWQAISPPRIRRLIIPWDLDPFVIT